MKTAVSVRGWYIKRRHIHMDITLFKHMWQSQRHPIQHLVIRQCKPSNRLVLKPVIRSDDHFMVSFMQIKKNLFSPGRRPVRIQMLHHGLSIKKQFYSITCTDIKHNTRRLIDMKFSPDEIVIKTL